MPEQITVEPAPNQTKKRYRFSNRDLLTIAILSGLGGVMSTYIGYLGNLINHILGVPFGAGQFLAGLHVIWIMLAAGLVRQTGAATACGLLKGIVELLTGSTHGSIIVVVSFVQGLLADLVLSAMKKRNPMAFGIAGGVGTAANVIVFQLAYFSGARISYLLLMTGVSFLSGVLFAGLLGLSVLDTLKQIRPIRSGTLFNPETEQAGYGVSATTNQTSTGKGSARHAPASQASARHTPESKRFFRIFTAIVIVAFLAGSMYYFATIYEFPWKGAQCIVEGNVENPMSFNLAQFREAETTIVAELTGQVTHVPPQEYTGIPVNFILKQAKPKPGADTLFVVATDGYKVEFELEKVIEDDNMLLILEEDDTLRLIAAEYAGGYWVRQVSALVIE